MNQTIPFMRPELYMFVLASLLGHIIDAPVRADAQALSSGQYYGSSEGKITTLSLYDDGTFFITVTDGKNGVAGRGEWRDERIALRLLFTRPFHFDFPRWEIVDSKEADETVISVSSHYSPNELALPGTTVNPVPYSQYGTVVDVKGRAELEIPSDLDFEYVELNFIGYMSVRIPFSELRGRNSIVRAHLVPTTHEYDFQCSHCKPIDPEQRYETVFGLKHQLHGRIALTHDAFSIELEKRQ